MARALAHRGPDHQGLFQDRCCALSYRRLSVIDLAGGNQPVVHEPTGAVLVFNGEIYNYQPLRAELASLGHVFRTHSRLRSPARGPTCSGGDKCLRRLVGMFAFAVWTPRAQTLFLARDRMGKKPLFYTLLPDGTLVFASEIKAILHFPGVPRSMNPLAMDRLLDYGFNLAPDTFLQGISQVPPAHILLADGSGHRTAPYWDIPMDRPVAKISEDEAAEGLRHHLVEAVRDRLVADVPVASYLSGGIDSQQRDRTLCAPLERPPCTPSPSPSRTRAMTNAISRAWSQARSEPAITNSSAPSPRRKSKNWSGIWRARWSPF